MKITWFVAAVALASLGSFMVAGQEGEQPETPKPSASVTIESKLFELMKERRETLQQVVDALNAKYRMGEAQYTDVLAAEVRLAEADLELAPNLGARQIIHERRINHLRQQEGLIQALIVSGDATQADFLNVKAARLQAEIDMIRDYPRRGGDRRREKH